MKLTPRTRGIVYVVLVVAGVIAGVGQAIAPDVAAEAAPVAGGWVETVLAVVAVIGGVLARLNLTPAAPALTDLERQADADAAVHDPTPGTYDGERVVYMALTEAETDAALEARGWLSQAHPGHPLLAVIDRML